MTETGIWNDWEAEHHIMSDDLAMKLQLLMDPGICTIDMGCGRGDYIRNLLDENFECCVGVEGSVLPQHVGMDIRHLDLAVPFNLGLCGRVMSFEVGEHIPKEYEQIFLDNLTSHCLDMLILSWGLPGQVGIGHVNCQPREYIIAELYKRGFAFDEEETAFIKAAPYKETPWFAETLMVFKRWLPS